MPFTAVDLAAGSSTTLRGGFEVDMTPLWRSNGQCCPNLRSDSPRMSQYVGWAKPQNRPTEAVQRVDSLDVVLEHPAASMVIAFVLNAQPPLRIGEIELCHQEAEAVNDLVLRRCAGGSSPAPAPPT
jgi:hypothetical protein